jgi:hypothetical protein
VTRIEQTGDALRRGRRRERDGVGPADGPAAAPGPRPAGPRGAGESVRGQERRPAPRIQLGTATVPRRAMNPLRTLPLADLLHEVRTAERLAVAIPPRPAEEAAAKLEALDALRSQRLNELARRADLIEQARARPARQG